MAYQLLLYYLIFLLLFPPVKKKRRIVFKKFEQLIIGWCLKFNSKSLNQTTMHSFVCMGFNDTILLCTQTFYNCAHIQLLPLWKQFVQLKNIPVKIKGLSKVSGYQSIAKSHIHSITNPMLTRCLHLRKNCAIEKKVLNLKKNVFILTDSGLGRKKEMMIESKFIVRSLLR